MDIRKLTLLTGSTLTVMAGATIAPSLPQIQESFSEKDNAALLARLVLTAPALFIAIGSPLAGKIVDSLGRIRIILAGLIIYAVGGTAPLYLNDIYSIIASRAVLGIGVAGIMTGFTTLIGDYYEGDKRNRIMGLQSAFMAFGGFAYVLAGGILADIHWRWPFAIYAFSLVVLPFAWSALNEPSDHDHKITADASENSLSLRDKFSIWFTLFLGLLFFIIFYMMPVQLPFYLEEMGVESNTRTGIALACLTLTAGLAGLFYQRIRSWLNFRQVYTLLFFLAFSGYFLVSVIDSFAWVLFAQVIGGLGFGLFMPNANLYLMNLVPFRIRGRVIGGMTTAVFLGQFLSPIVVNPLQNEVGLGMSFQIAAYVMAAISVVFLLSLRNKTR